MTTPDALFKTIQADLEHALHTFENGGKIDMASLDKKVREFCGMVTALPAAQAKQFEPKMHLIIEELTKVVSKLHGQRDEISEQLDSLNQRQRATNAYGQANILKEPKEED